MTRLDTRLSRRPIGILLFAAFLLVWAMLTKVHTHSWQEESRMATVQALVEQGTFAIDHTEFNRTGDKVFVNGHFYSDKTPLLSVAAAGVYSILHNVFGLTLDPAICVPDEDPGACRAFGPEGARLTAFYWLTLIFVGGSSALLITLSWAAMIELGVGGVAATGLATALGLASPIAPYSIVFAGHVPAAVCLFAGFRLLIAGTTGILTRRRAFWAGVLISLSANIDLTLAVFIATFGVWLLLTRRSGVMPFAFGVVVPFALSAAINYWAAGTIVPLYFDPKAYDFLGTVLNKTVGGTQGFYTLDFGLRYTFDMLVGQRGVFSFTPVLAFALAGAWRAMRDPRSDLRTLTLAMLLGWLAFALYLILRTDNFGGKAWGTRWFVPLVPMLWYFVPMCFGLSSPADRARPAAWCASPWWRVAFVGAVALSFWMATLGLHDTWRTVEFPIRLP